MCYCDRILLSRNDLQNLAAPWLVSTQTRPFLPRSAAELSPRYLAGHEQMARNQVGLQLQTLVREPRVVHHPRACERRRSREELPLRMVRDTRLGEVGEQPRCNVSLPDIDQRPTLTAANPIEP